MRRPLLTTVTIAVLIVLATPAAAHVELFEADPEPGGTATEGTQTISLTLVSLDATEPVRVGVVDEDGVDQVSGSPRVRPPDRGTEVVVPVRPLALGEHTVTWTATSDDGDESSGTYTFTVIESTQGDATWVLWLGVALVVGVVLFVVVRRSRRS